MDFLKQWTVCVCMTLVVAVILSLLTPNSSMGRFYKMLISIFIFLSFVYPFADFEMSLPEYQFTANDDDINNAVNDSSQIMIKNNILSVLNGNNIVGCAVDVDTYFVDDMVYVDEILVTVPDEYDTQNVKQLIFDNLSLNADVVHIGQ